LDRKQFNYKNTIGRQGIEMADLDFAVKYPFSSEGKKALGEMEVTDEIMDKAVRLILASLTTGINPKQYVQDYEKREDIAAYALSRMILGAMRNRYLTNNFAISMSKFARRNINYENPENTKRLIDEFGIRIKGNEIYLVDYLRFSPRDQHYTLFNREFHRGWVKINDNELKRILEEAVKKHVEKIPFLKNPSKQIKDAIKQIEKEMPKRERKIEIKPGDYPPCIVYLLDEVKKHHNLPHQARFFLAVYLIEAGMKDEQIISIFSNLPDFQEKTTRYQVEHARKHGYSVPSCSTVMSYGLCRADCGIRNPLNWRGRK